MPFVTQNGVWIEDAIDGAAFSFTAKNIPSLDISNTDLTFFAGFATDHRCRSRPSRNRVFGLAGFADLLRGYIEYGYGYVKADDDDLSYHNVTVAFSRRYMGRLANSVRVIGNFGQKGDRRGENGRRHAGARRELAHAEAALGFDVGPSTR